jgi:hypothetical protein
MAEQIIKGLQAVGTFTVAGEVYTDTPLGLVDADGVTISFERNNEMIETAMSQVPYDILNTATNIKLAFKLLSAALEKVAFALGLSTDSVTTEGGTKTLEIPADGLGSADAVGFYVKFPADTAGARTVRCFKAKPSGNLEQQHNRSHVKTAVEMSVLLPDSGPIVTMTEPTV